MATQIQVRRDTAANWTASTAVLAQGEMGLELDTGKFKFGDGVKTWTLLGYAGSGGGGVPTKTSDLTNDGEDGANPFLDEADVYNILQGND